MHLYLNGINKNSVVGKTLKIRMCIYFHLQAVEGSVKNINDANNLDY